MLSRCVVSIILNVSTPVFSEVCHVYFEYVKDPCTAAAAAAAAAVAAVAAAAVATAALY